jgi:hypothetical protein
MTAAALCRNMATSKRCAAGFGNRQRAQLESRDAQKLCQRSLHGNGLSLEMMYFLCAAVVEPVYATAEYGPTRLCRMLSISCSA